MCVYVQSEDTKAYGEENLAAFLMNKNKVLLNKQRCVAAAILALSKTVMYGFHYGYMMDKFPNNKLLFTDTDSFCYSIPNVSKEEYYSEIFLKYLALYLLRHFNN